MKKPSFLALILATYCTSLFASGTLELVNLDTAESEKIADLEDVAIDNSGRVVFECRTTNNRSAIYRNSGGLSYKMLRAGDSYDQTSNTLYGIQEWGLSPSGHLAATAFLGYIGPSYSSMYAIVTVDKDLSSIECPVRDGDPAPDGNGTYDVGLSTTDIAITDGGKVVFCTAFEGSNNVAQNSGIVRIDTKGTDQLLIRDYVYIDEEQDYMIGKFIADDYQGFESNSNGEILTTAKLIGAEDSQNEGLVYANTVSWDRVVWENETSPGGTHTYSAFQPFRGSYTGGGMAFNDNREFAVLADATNDDDLLLIGNSEGVTEVVATGYCDGDHWGEFTFFSNCEMNNLGQVIFGAYVQVVGHDGESGIFMYDPADKSDDHIKAIVEHGDWTPDGTGQFVLPEEMWMMLNEQGQVAFYSHVDTNGDDILDKSGYYFYDGSTIHEIIETGDVIEGHTVLTIRSSDDEERTRLNDRGQVAIKIEDPAYNEYIVKWSPDGVSSVVYDPDDFLRFWISQNSSGEVLIHCIPYDENCSYVLESSEDISDSDRWAEVKGVEFTGSLTEQVANLGTPESSSEFYRIRIISE